MRKKKRQVEASSSDSGYGHVLKYTGMFGFIQVLKILMTLVRNKLTSKLLGTYGMGLNAKFMNIGEMVNSCTNCGISFSSVQHISEIYSEGSDEDRRLFVGVIRTWSLWTSVVGALVCALFAGVFNRVVFEGENHIWEIFLLSMFVASLPIEAGECSILKGMRRMGQLAGVEIAVTLLSLVFTIPFYYFWGVRGIVVSLVLCGWANALIHLSVSTRIFPYRVHVFSCKVLLAGIPLITRGLPYMLAAIAGSVSTMLVFSVCLEDNHQVGLYKACFSLMVSYAGLVLQALESDYFPRLSQVNHDAQRMNFTINQQIDVCVLLMAPLLMAFVMFMPWIVRLLYSEEFLPVVSMAQCAVFYMFFKAVTAPIAYTALAKGDSVVYLIMEFVYDVFFVLAMYLGYRYWNLFGVGVALSLVSLFDLLIISLVYGIVYHTRLRRSTLFVVISQTLLMILVVLASVSCITWLKYSVGIPCFLFSAWMAWRMILRGSGYLEKLRNRLHR